MDKMRKKNEQKLFCNRKRSVQLNTNEKFFNNFLMVIMIRIITKALGSMCEYVHFFVVVIAAAAVIRIIDAYWCCKDSYRVRQ